MRHIIIVLVAFMLVGCSTSKQIGLSTSYFTARNCPYHECKPMAFQLDDGTFSLSCKMEKCRLTKSMHANATLDDAIREWNRWTAFESKVRSYR